MSGEASAENDNAAPAVSANNEVLDIQRHQETLVNMAINTQNDALNCLIGYIGLAQRRGTFALDESAKLFDCIKKFGGSGV